jgi:hypothetical protein
LAFNGSGTFNRIYNWVNDKNNNIDITASRMDGEDNGFATGLSTCITKDGQQTTTALIPFAVGLSVNQGSASTPAISVAGDATTGFYQPTGGQIFFASLSNVIGGFMASGIQLNGSLSGSCVIGVPAAAGTGTIFTLPATNGTNGQLLQTNGSGVTSWVNVASGSGTVNSGTSGQLAYYASSTNAVSSNAQISISSGALTLGTATSTLGSLILSGSTSGTTTLNPNVAASGTLTLPAATDTLIGKATTDTLTNKTYDTAGTGNTFKINGQGISAVSGNTTKVATVTGSLTSGHLASFDGSGNIQDSGSAIPLMTPLGVGSIIWAALVTSVTVTAGSTTSAANLTCLVSSGISSPVFVATADSLTGTWKALQTVVGNGVISNAQAGLWQRIS